MTSPTNRLDMKTLKQLACWGTALKTMASELSQPSQGGQIFKGQDPLKNVGMMLQMAESNFDAMPPDEYRATIFALAQNLGIEVIEDGGDDPSQPNE